MSNGTEPRSGVGVALNYLPWLVGAGALVVYLLTINHWVSLLNWGQVAKTAGWVWQPELFNLETPILSYPPVYFVLTYPLRWLPPGWIPLALNFFSAACAAITLGLLARSVALLPHDRTHDQRDREFSESAVLTIPLAWVPSVLAVIACGLQLTFWEHATNGTGEMLALMIFAFVIRALLEYRVDGRDVWLYRAALAYGLGVTGNFAMIGFFPLFIVSLIWLRGLGFFNLRFLTRMFLLGLAGLSLYLLLPLLASFDKIEPVNFWAGLKHCLAGQKACLVYFPWKELFRISLTSLLPVLVMSIRWASNFGESSHIGQIIAKAVFHVVHAVFLCATLWVTLDPPVSPRNVAAGIPFLSFLSFYYLGALALGYFAGYLLLVFRPKRDRASSRRRTPVENFLHKLSTTVVLVLLFATPAALLLRNLGEIRKTNGRMIWQYARQSAQSLPKSGVLLSDDPQRLFFMQAWLIAAGRSQDFIVINTQSLNWPGYHRYLNKRFPGKWSAPDEKQKIRGFDDASLVELMRKLAKTSEIWYLQPSFGYYFEICYPEPHGLIYRLKEYPSDRLLPPSLTPEIFAENESFWRELKDSTLPPVLATTATPDPTIKPGLVDLLFKKLHLSPRQNMNALVLGLIYSRSLNYWGVETQKLGKLAEAADHFKTALDLNPKNVVAEINSAYNKNLQAGKRAAVELPKSIEDRFGDYYRSWDQVIGANGPFDEPSLCYAQGYTYLQSGLHRQAAQQFDRVREYVDTDLPSRLWLAQLNLMAQLPDAALQITREIHEHPDRFKLDATNHTDLLTIEASALLAKNEITQAESLIETAINRDPTDVNLLSNCVGIYARNGRFTNALAVLDRQLVITPDDTMALFNKGFVSIQLSRYDEGITALTRLLTVDTNNSAALLNRAIAYLRNDQLDQARIDYETLQRQYPAAFQVNYGLAEIALRRKDTNAAIAQYEAYLANAPTNSAETQAVIERLKQFKGVKTK